MRVLIVAEHDHLQLNPATLHAVTAVKELGTVDLIVIGKEVQSVVDQARKITGVAAVLYSEAEHYQTLLAEELAPLIVSIADQYQYFAATATRFGKNLMPRVAALLDVSQISGLTEIVDAHTFVRPVYAGNVFETVSSSEEKLVLTIRATAFEPAVNHAEKAFVREIAALPAKGDSKLIRREQKISDRPELTQARVVVSGGRGLSSKDAFNQIMLPLAEVLNAAVGASRAAVDAGFVANDLQIGQTGKIVAPELYVAVGISGAIQHEAGMHDSKVVVAINKDSDAPIFNIADYGLVADLFEAVPELVDQLKVEK